MDRSCVSMPMLAKKIYISILININHMGRACGLELCANCASFVFGNVFTMHI